LTLLTPLIITSSLLFPFITGKAFFFRGVIEITAALWLVLAWRVPEYRPRRSLVVWSGLAFILVAVLATVFSQNPAASFWSNFERMEGLVGYLHLFFYFLILTSVFRSEKIWRWFFHGVVAIGLILVGYSLAQLAGWRPISLGRIDATLGNSTYLAIYLLFSVFITGLLGFKNRGLAWTRWLYLAAGLFQVFIIYRTTTRGTLLGLAAGILATLVLILIGKNSGKRLRRLAGAGLALGLILAGLFWFGRDSSFVKGSPTLSRFAAISVTETTTDSRLTIWQMAFKGFKERPILGWGPDNFILVFNKYYEPNLWRQEPWFDSSHNAFIDWLTVAGLLGFLAYAGLFGAGFTALRRSKNLTAVEKSLLAGLLAAYIVNNLFVFDNLTSYLLFFAVLAYLNFSVLPPLVIKPSRTKSEVAWLVPAVVALLLAGSFYFVNIKPWSVASNLIKALGPGSISLAERRAYFEKIFAAQTFGSREGAQQLWSLAGQVLTSGEVAAPEKTAWKNLADQAYLNLPTSFGLDARYHYLYAVFLRAINRPAEAVPIMEKALTLSPQKQLFLVELAADYGALGDSKKSLALVERAYALAPAAENTAVADILINAYSAVRRYDEVLKLWQERVAVDPNNVQARFSLAAAYLANGQRALSIASLEAAIKIDPRVEAQARAIIAEIRAGRNPLQN
jgi:O-antigen ligase